MNKIITLLICFSFITTLDAQQFNPSELQVSKIYGKSIAETLPITEIFEFDVNTIQTNQIYLQNGLRSQHYLNPKTWLSIHQEVVPQKVQIIFSKYPIRATGYHMQYTLLCNRLINLFEIDPNLNSTAIDFEIVLQTNCINDDQVNQLFHGVVIEYQADEIAQNSNRVVTTLKKEEKTDSINNNINTGVIDSNPTVSTITKIATAKPNRDEQNSLELLSDSVRNILMTLSPIERKPFLIKEFTAQLKDTTRIDITPSLLKESGKLVDQFARAHTSSSDLDSTVLKVFERNNQWKKILVVADWTGSMYQYGAQASLWHILNYEKSELDYLTLFNDGDYKLTHQKEIGKTDGVYFQDADRLDKIIQLYNLVKLKGEGGDEKENDLEAILKGMKKFPDHQDIVLIADNNSCVRDMELLEAIKKPVRVILCGYSNLKKANPQYLKIAQKTGGSIHTIEADIFKITDKTYRKRNVELKVGDVPCSNKKRRNRRKF